MAGTRPIQFIAGKVGERVGAGAIDGKPVNMPKSVRKE